MAAATMAIPPDTWRLLEYIRVNAPLPMWRDFIKNYVEAKLANKENEFSTVIEVMVAVIAANKTTAEIDAHGDAKSDFKSDGTNDKTSEENKVKESEEIKDEKSEEYKVKKESEEHYFSLSGEPIYDPENEMHWISL